MPNYVVREITKMWDHSPHNRDGMDIISERFQEVLAEQVAAGFRLHSFTHSFNQTPTHVFEVVIAVFAKEPQLRRV